MGGYCFYDGKEGSINAKSASVQNTERKKELLETIFSDEWYYQKNNLISCFPLYHSSQFRGKLSEEFD